MPRKPRSPLGPKKVTFAANIGASIIQAIARPSDVPGMGYVSFKVYGELAKQIQTFHDAFGTGGPVQETVRELLILALNSPITRESSFAAVRLRALAEARTFVYDGLRDYFAAKLSEIDTINKAAREAYEAAKAMPDDTPGLPTAPDTGA